MARPREFDIDQALQQAMVVFWEKGFLGASLQDLMKATGLNKQSLYNAFGDKQELFLKALGLYRTRNLAALKQFLEQVPSPGAALAAFLRHSARLSEVEQCPKGCLIGRTAFDQQLAPPGAMDEVRRMQTGVEKILTETIEQAQSAGEIGSSQEPQALALLMINTTTGIRVMEQSGWSKRKIETAVEAAVQTIFA